MSSIKTFPVATVEEAGFDDYGFRKTFHIDKNRQIKVLITGANSYIGDSFRDYCKENYPKIETTTIDMVDDSWREHDFSGYDTVFHVAGIAHADVGNATAEEKRQYYAVNTELAIEAAGRAKKCGVKQFVFMSSMIIYGDAERIDAQTLPHPANFYGDSKWQADKGVRALQDERFRTAVLRPPMIYGRNSKGNYRTLAGIAKRTPFFPDYPNRRSMLYTGNLCEFLCLLMLSGEGGIYFPQNRGYTKTASMVGAIGAATGKTIKRTRFLNPAVSLSLNLPGKIGNLARKAFGSCFYTRELSQYNGLDYQIFSGAESILRSEEITKKKHILVISQYFHPETFRVNDMAVEWVKRGYKVTVLTGIPNYPMGKFFEGYGLRKRRREQWNGVDIIRIPLIARGNSSNKLINAGGMTANYLSFVLSGRRWVKSKEARELHADLVFTVEVSPMTQALIGCWYGKRYHVPAFLYVQDLWPENVETVTGIHSPLVIRPIEKMVDYIYRHTNQIFATSPAFVNTIEKRGVHRGKIHFWPQYAEAFCKPMPRKEAEQRLLERNNSDLTTLVQKTSGKETFFIAFTGNIGTAQGLDILPKSAELLKGDGYLTEKMAGIEKRVHFIIVGDGRYQKTLEHEIGKKQVGDCFTFVPRQEAEVIPEILALADVAFLSFQDEPLWTMTIPAKLQSYMACGMPMIASAAGETKRIIEEAACGLCAEIGNAEELAKAIRQMMDENLEEMSHNSSRYAAENFDKDRLMAYMDKKIATE